MIRNYLSSLFIAAIVLALFGVMLCSLYSWTRVREAFQEINTTYLPVLERSGKASLNISTARTEFFRYENGYEPSPYKVQTALNKAKSNLQWIAKQHLPAKTVQYTQELLDETDQFQVVLQRLAALDRQYAAVQAGTLENRLSGEGTALAALAAQVKDVVHTHIMDSISSLNTNLLRSNAILAGIAVSVITLLIGGFTLHNRHLYRQVEEKTKRLQASLQNLRESEKSLQESEGRYRELADLLPQTVFETDASGRLRYANRIGMQSFGYTEHDRETGILLRDLAAPAYREMAEKRLERTLAGATLHTQEFTAMRKDGSTFPALIYSDLIRTGQNISGMRGIIIDISDRKKAELELERLATAIKQTSDVIVITDPSGTIQYVNPAFEQITGFTEHEAVGSNPRILKSGKQSQEFYKLMWETLAQGSPWEGFLVNQKKDGSHYTEKAAISPVLNEEGHIVNYIAVKRDVTEELKMEEHLRQAQKVEAIGRLAGGVAHDLNNLLSPILGYSEILLMELEPTAEQKEAVDEIFQAGIRARDLVRQLLAFSRRQTLEFTPVDINATIEDFRKLLRRTIREDIEIQVQLSPATPHGMADIGQIEQVIMNLAVNAAEAMPSGGTLLIETGQVELDETYAKTHHGVTPGPYVMLAVSDTGMGMDSLCQTRIFDPFYTTKGEQGTGLGLATVYGIVKQHSGNIWVYSEPGHGSTFKIYLPIADTETVREIQLDGRLADTISEGSGTILLVEDNQGVRNLAQDILQRHGYHVISAEDGARALRTLQSQDTIDLLLTDVVLPEMNGKELYSKVAAAIPRIKVLYMSGYTDNVIAHHGVLDQGVEFIQKPFTLHGLVRKVQEVLSSCQ